MGVILLVRHGQASWGAPDYDNLSSVGHEQGRLLGTALAARGIRPTHVVSGSMRRHGQTAERLLEGAGWEHAVSVDDGWNEFDHVQMLEVHGGPEGEEGQLSRQQFDAWFDDATERWTAGGHDDDYDEPFHGFRTRVESALRRTSSALGSGDVAVVCTSGGPISWVTASLLGGGVDMWMRLNPVVVNSSVTKVVVGRTGTTLVSLNDHSHLEPDHVTYR
ncbi:MAG TPA: histidine phosphatase family protein [Marmoricola sp.]|nr:histidine phosphatase family protein [Marmoricola sp.]